MSKFKNSKACLHQLRYVGFIFIIFILNTQYSHSFPTGGHGEPPSSEDGFIEVQISINMWRCESGKCENAAVRR